MTVAHEDPQLLADVYAMARAFTNRVFTVTSGDRTRQPSGGAFPVAPEGKSNHEIYASGRGPYDEAVDLVVDGVPIAQSPVGRLLSQFHLHAPVAGDPVHTELLGVNG